MYSSKFDIVAFVLNEVNIMNNTGTGIKIHVMESICKYPQVYYYAHDTFHNVHLENKKCTTVLRVWKGASKGFYEIPICRGREYVLT